MGQQVEISSDNCDPQTFQNRSFVCFSTVSSILDFVLRHLQMFGSFSFYSILAQGSFQKHNTDEDHVVRNASVCGCLGISFYPLLLNICLRMGYCSVCENFLRDEDRLLSPVVSVICRFSYSSPLLFVVSAQDAFQLHL